jgi:hypothetical protein
MRERIEILLRRSTAYRQCFLDDKGELTPAARIVMADLARFCCATETTTVVSPTSRQTDVPATMQREGRREVFTRMWRTLRLPINKLYEIEETRE